MSSARLIRSGSATVKIFANRTVVRGKAYLRHEIRWTDHHGRRRRLKRSSLSKALAEARRIASNIARAQPAAELNLAQVSSFKAAVESLYGTGNTIQTVAAEYAEACRLCPGVSLAELAAFHVKHAPKRREGLPVELAVERFVHSKVGQGVSARWIQTMRSQLKRFKADFQCDMADVTATAVQAWFLGLPNLTARSRNNYLAAVQALFTLPELDAHPELRAIQRLQAAQEAAPAVALWSPAEFRNLLETALLAGDARHRHLLPVLVLGGLAKLRTAEIMRLRWEAVRPADGQVLLEGWQTKTRRRRLAPLPPAAAAWLTRIGSSSGRVWPWGERKLHSDLRKLAHACGLEWRHNSLRKSANTYAMLLDPDASRVAGEAGNSPSMLERHYLAFEGLSRADAEAWFAIEPPPSEEKIVPMKQQAGPQK